MYIFFQISAEPSILSQLVGSKSQILEEDKLKRQNQIFESRFQMH